MPSIFRTPDGGAIIYLTAEEIGGKTEPFASLRGPAFDAAWDKFFHRTGRIEDFGAGNKPLAPRKPSKRRSKGLASKAGKQARKGAGKK